MSRKVFPLALLAALLLTSASCGTKETPDSRAEPTALKAAVETGSVVTMSTFDMASMEGKVIFVELWGVWCPPCIRSMPHVQQVWEQYRSNEAFEMMVLNTGWRGDTPDKVRGWLKQNSRYSFPVYFDDRPQNQQFAMQHKVDSIPRSIILDKQGKVRYNGHPMQVPKTLLDELLAEAI
jgi:thiol-disulfide isomerase/thioredoxin